MKTDKLTSLFVLGTFLAGHTALNAQANPNLPSTGDAAGIIIEAEDFNNNPGVGYIDTTAPNFGGAYRNTSVDIGAKFQEGHYVGWIAAGEMLAYTINNPNPGLYDFTFSVASAQATNKTFHVEIDGVNVSGPITFNTGGAGWQSWQEVIARKILLDSPVETIRIVMDSANFNIDNFMLSKEGVDLPILPVYAGTYFESHPLNPNRIRANSNGSVGFILNNTWFAFSNFGFSNASTPGSIGVELELAKGNANNNARVEVRLNGPTGQLLANIPVTNTGGWGNFETFKASFPVSVTGSGALYFVFKGNPGFLMDVGSVRLTSHEVGTVIEAENFNSESNPNSFDPVGIVNIPDGIQLIDFQQVPSFGNQKVGYTRNNNWIKFDGVRFGGFSAVSGPGADGINIVFSKAGNVAVNDIIEVRLDSPNGLLLETVGIYPTNSWDNYTTAIRTFDGLQVVSGIRDLYLVFKGNGFIADVDSFMLTKRP